MPYHPDGVDPLHIPNPETGKYYRFLDSSNPMRMAQHLRHYGARPGYKLVQGATVAETKKLCRKLGFPEAYVDVARNRIAYADLVLAEIPMEEHKLRRAETLKRSRKAADDVDAAYYEHFESLRSRHVRPFIREPEEIADRAKFARREGQPFVSLTAG